MKPANASELGEAGPLGVRERLDEFTLGGGPREVELEEVGELEQSHTREGGQGRPLAGLRHWGPESLDGIKDACSAGSRLPCCRPIPGVPQVDRGARHQSLGPGSRDDGL